MKSGIFHVPYMRPERTPREVFDYSVLIAREADEAGFADFMIGEHATQGRESVPNPQIVIGACARETERIRFAPMAHLLPLHIPGSLAIQVGWLSQVLEGRYFLGVGPGAYPRDAVLRGPTGRPVRGASPPRRSARDHAADLATRTVPPRGHVLHGWIPRGGTARREWAPRAHHAGLLAVEWPRESGDRCHRPLAELVVDGLGRYKRVLAHLVLRRRGHRPLALDYLQRDIQEACGVVVRLPASTAIERALVTGVDGALQRAAAAVLPAYGVPDPASGVADADVAEVIRQLLHKKGLHEQFLEAIVDELGSVPPVLEVALTAIAAAADVNYAGPTRIDLAAPAPPTAAR